MNYEAQEPPRKSSSHKKKKHRKHKSPEPESLKEVIPEPTPPPIGLPPQDVFSLMEGPSQPPPQHIPPQDNQIQDILFGNQPIQPKTE